MAPTGLRGLEFNWDISLHEPLRVFDIFQRKHVNGQVKPNTKIRFISAWWNIDIALIH